MSDVDNELAARIHGAFYSDSHDDSSSDGGKSESDEELEACRPPPVLFEDFQHRIVKIPAFKIVCYKKPHTKTIYTKSSGAPGPQAKEGDLVGEQKDPRRFLGNKSTKSVVAKGERPAQALSSHKKLPVAETNIHANLVPVKNCDMVEMEPMKELVDLEISKPLGKPKKKRRRRKKTPKPLGLFDGSVENQQEKISQSLNEMKLSSEALPEARRNKGDQVPKHRFGDSTNKAQRQRLFFAVEGDKLLPTNLDVITQLAPTSQGNFAAPKQVTNADLNKESLFQSSCGRTEQWGKTGEKFTSDSSEENIQVPVNTGELTSRTTHTQSTRKVESEQNEPKDISCIEINQTNPIGLLWKSVALDKTIQLLQQETHKVLCKTLDTFDVRKTATSFSISKMPSMRNDLLIPNTKVCKRKGPKRSGKEVEINTNVLLYDVNNNITRKLLLDYGDIFIKRKLLFNPATKLIWEHDFINVFPGSVYSSNVNPLFLIRTRKINQNQGLQELEVVEPRNKHKYFLPIDTNATTQESSVFLIHKFDSVLNLKNQRHGILSKICLGVRFWYFFINMLRKWHNKKS